MRKRPDLSDFPSSSKIKFEDSEENEPSSEESEFSADDEGAEIKNGLADVTFEELQNALSDGTVALHPKRVSENKPKRANKNRPMERSSKKPVSRFREVIQVPKKLLTPGGKIQSRCCRYNVYPLEFFFSLVFRDPRFESLCGKFDEEGFKKRYSFIYEESLPAEKEDLKKQLRSTKDPLVIEELKNRISAIDKLMKSDSTKIRKAQIMSEHKKRVREAVKQGKRPFYIKKSAIREQLQIEKYNKLKASGKLDSYIEKKRRRNASKDHKFMPYKRTRND